MDPSFFCDDNYSTAAGKNCNSIDDCNLMDLFPKDFGCPKSSVSISDTEMDFFRSFADSLLSNQPNSKHISSRSSSNDNLLNLNGDDMYFMQNCTSMSNFFDFGISLPQLQQEPPQQQQQQQQRSTYQSQVGSQRFDQTSSSRDDKPIAKTTRKTISKAPKIEIHSQHRSPPRCLSQDDKGGGIGAAENLRASRGSHSRGKKESELEKMIRAECSKKFKYEDGTTDTPYNTSKDRRRERNKVLARKTRMKKKAEMETLRDSVVSLVNENKKLKLVAKNHLPPNVSHNVLSACKLQLPDNINQMVHQVMSRSDRNLIYDLKSQQRSFCIVNAAAPDMPIVYASSAFCELTGYEMQEVVGKNCRLLQGPATDRNEVAKIKNALMAGEDVEAVLLNYRKNGKHFWNKLELHHLRDFSSKSSALIVGIQYEVHLSSDGKITQRSSYPDGSGYPQSSGGGSGSGGSSSSSGGGATSNDQLTLLVEGNTTRQGGSSFSSGSRNGGYSPSQFESRSSGQTDRDEKTSSDGGSTSDPSDRRSDND